MTVEETVEALRSTAENGGFSLSVRQLEKAPRTSLVSLSPNGATGDEQADLTIFLTVGQPTARVLVSDRYVFETVRVEDVLEFVDVVYAGHAEFRRFRYRGLIPLIEMNVVAGRRYSERRRQGGTALAQWESS
jgi:hypothetical protein